MKFRGKICVVTGASNGIGRCIAESFLKEGAFVAFIDTDKINADQFLAAHPDNLMFFHGDIADNAVLTEFAEKVITRCGHIDYLINNACLSRKGILSGCGFDDFNYVLKVGITAPYILTRLFLPYFSKAASVVNISSTRAFQSQADTESYTAAKGGITALTHALSISLSGKVRVNSISPGWIDTRASKNDLNYYYEPEDNEQHPAGRIGKPRDIAAMVIFLCGEEAGFITGENIVIDGGMSRQMIYHNDHGWTLSKKQKRI